MKLKFKFSILFALLFYSYLSAQPREELVKVIVTPNHNDWTYEIVEQAEFSIFGVQGVGKLIRFIHNESQNQNFRGKSENSPRTNGATNTKGNGQFYQRWFFKNRKCLFY